jgi:hypothetical protein
MRTLEDFVEDMIERGRTKKQILAVAEATRWRGRKAEIVAYGRVYKKIFKKSKNSAGK